MLTERSVKPLLETDGGKGEDMKGYKEHEMIVVRTSKEEQKFLFTRREKALKKYERSLIWKKRWRRFLQNMISFHLFVYKKRRDEIMREKEKVSMSITKEEMIALTKFRDKEKKRLMKMLKRKVFLARMVAVIRSSKRQVYGIIILILCLLLGCYNLFILGGDGEVSFCNAVFGLLGIALLLSK